jgi:predicted Co/Zn/Cd cation transporter (cation efflux family)
MNTETPLLENDQKQSAEVTLQHDTEGDTSTHFIAGLVAAECGVALTANWLLTASVTTTQTSLGYIGVAVLAWGSISVIHSIPVLLASGAESDALEDEPEQDASALTTDCNAAVQAHAVPPSAVLNNKTGLTTGHAETGNVMSTEDTAP